MPEPTPEPAVEPMLYSDAFVSTPASQAEKKSTVHKKFVAPKAQIIPKPVTQPKQVSVFWKNFEKKFIDNWTGILGTVVLVLGAGFLSIYAALKMAPQLRFYMISGIALSLGILSYALRKNAKLIQLSMWLRSGGGAIFLLACVGAGNIEGLKFVHDPFMAQILIGFGILVNLYLGHAGRAQHFASMHVLLSLTALAVAPQSHATMVVGTLVALAGVSFSYRNRWEYHLFATILSFFIFQLYWFYGGGVEISNYERHLARGCSLAVGLTTAFVHYRKIYVSKIFETIPFTVHISNWIFMGTVIAVYRTGSSLKTILLSIGAVAAFNLAKHAHRINIRWLYITDTIVSQILAALAIITLYKLEVEPFAIVGILFIESLVFLFFMVRQKENILTRVGIVISHVFVGTLLFFASVKMMIHPNNLNISIVILCGVGAMVFHCFQCAKDGEKLESLSFYTGVKTEPFFSLLGIASGLLLSLACFGLIQSSFAYIVIPCVLMLPLILRQMISSNGLSLGFCFVLVASHLALWIIFRKMPAETASYSYLLKALPLFLVTGFALKWNYVRYLKRRLFGPAVYMLGLHLAVTIYFGFNGVSPFIPAVLWLLLSVVALETAKVFRKPSDSPSSPMIHVGFMYLVFFVGRHLLVHLQAEDYIGPLKIRFLIEILAVCVLFIWASSKNKAFEKASKFWNSCHPLFLEFVLAFLVFIVVVEVSSGWHPLVWGLSAIVLLFMGAGAPESRNRLRFYSLLFNWATAFHVAFISSTQISPSLSMSSQPWILACTAIGTQVIYLIFINHRNCLDNIHFPKLLGFFRAFTEGIKDSKNVWIFYPFFACVGIFFYSSFSRSLLTMLWVFESFGIFVLSMILGITHFRHLANIVILLCLEAVDDRIDIEMILRFV